MLCNYQLFIPQGTLKQSYGLENEQYKIEGFARPLMLLRKSKGVWLSNCPFCVQLPKALCWLTWRSIVWLPEALQNIQSTFLRLIIIEDFPGENDFSFSKPI